MPSPDLFHPHARPQAEIAPPGSYRAGDPVWVHRGGRWRPGLVVQASSRAVLVRYRTGDQPGTGVDTVTAVHLAVRTDLDQMLDQSSSTGGRQ